MAPADVYEKLGPNAAQDLGGFPKLRDPLFGGVHNDDYSFLGVNFGALFMETAT